jgi:tetratricopeptide (TPR) repeat protein
MKHNFRSRFPIVAALLMSWLMNGAAGQQNQYSGDAIAHALEAQEYAIGITTAAANDPNISVAVESAQKALGTARRAIQLDNSIAIAYSVLGLVYRQIWRWTEARAAFEHAYELDPNDPSIAFNYGWFSSFAGDHERAIEVARRVVGIYPNNANAHRDLGLAFAFAGNEEAASAALRQCIAIDSTVGLCHIYLGFMQSRLGNFALAEGELREAESSFGRNLSPAAASSLAHAYSMAGLTSDAARLFERLASMANERVVGAGSWPLGFLAIGDNESAYEWLTRAVEKARQHEPDEGFFNMMIIKHNVQANPVLDEPRFRALRDQIGAQ